MSLTTRWDFLYSYLLVGVEQATGRLYALPSQAREPLLAMWTSPEVAEQALPPGYQLTATKVRPRLAELPAGVGIVVDPGTDETLVVDPDYAQELRRYVHPFPAGTMLEFRLWRDLPARVREALVESVRGYSFVEAVWAMLYTIDDSPHLGCLVYRTEAGTEGQESVVDALSAALDATTSPQELGVPVVEIVAAEDLPESVAAGVLRARPLYGPRG